MAAALVWAAAGPAGAFTIYDNFGPGDSYDTLNTTLAADYRDAAVSFEVTASDTPFLLDSIELALQGGGGGASFHVQLALDDAGQPGSILETVTSLQIFGTPSILTASFSGNTLIDTPGTYWVWLEMDSGSYLSWYLNDQGMTSDCLTSDDGASTWVSWPSSTEPAFRVNAVPEPSTALLLSFGLMGLGVGGRRRAL